MSTTYVSKTEFRAQKARLTRAVNSGDPLKVLDAVERTLDEWQYKVWPDDWARWARALDDAYWKFTRSFAYTEYNAARFREVFDRIHG